MTLWVRIKGHSKKLARFVERETLCVRKFVPVCLAHYIITKTYYLSSFFICKPPPPPLPSVNKSWPRPNFKPLNLYLYALCRGYMRVWQSIPTRADVASALHGYRHEDDTIYNEFIYGNVVVPINISWLPLLKLKAITYFLIDWHRLDVFDNTSVQCKVCRS